MAQSNNCPFDITPYTQSQVITTPNIFSLNYTNQDFWSMKTRLIDFIKQKFSTDFSDFVESSIAIMLIENWAFIADTLSFKMDQISNEIFTSNSRGELVQAFPLRESTRELLSSFNYDGSDDGNFDSNYNHDRSSQ